MVLNNLKLIQFFIFFTTSILPIMGAQAGERSDSFVFFILGQNPAHLSKISEPGRLDRYAIWGTNGGEYVVVPRTVKNTCKNHSVFWEWYRAIDMKSIEVSAQAGHTFVWAANNNSPVKHCMEDEKTVTFFPMAGIEAWDEEGNRILAEYVKRVNGTQFSGAKLQFQAPRHTVSRYGIEVQSKEGRSFIASYFRESQNGMGARDSFRELSRFDGLIQSMSSSKAIEEFFVDRLMNPDELKSILDLAKEAAFVWYFSDQIYEYQDDYNRPIYSGFYFEHDDFILDWNRSSYSCIDSVCKRIPNNISGVFKVSGKSLPPSK